MIHFIKPPLPHYLIRRRPQFLIFLRFFSEPLSAIILLKDFLKGEMIMPEQVLIQFSIDKDLRQEVANIYESLGMDLNTAFRMFLIRSKMERGLPFSAKLPEPSRVDAWNAFQELRKQAADVPEMSLDEINAEIAAVRAERRRRS